MGDASLIWKGAGTQAEGAYFGECDNPTSDNHHHCLSCKLIAKGAELKRALFNFALEPLNGPPPVFRFISLVEERLDQPARGRSRDGFNRDPGFCQSERFPTGDK